MAERSHLYRHKFYTFDIETTTLITGLDENKQPIRNGIIWSGQFYDGADYIQTRSLKDTIKRLKLIEDEAKDYGGDKLVIFVHFLSYEFQFIKDFFKWEKILCTSPRKIIAAETETLCFRCSNMLSNQSLEKFLKNEGVPEEYQKTNMDYLKDRFPWTEITEEEYVYCRNDVVGLHMAITRRIEDCTNKDINNLPLTSTGYVRKDCRKAVALNKSNRFRFKKEALDIETFRMNHKAFRGGNTHANRYFVNKTVHNVGQEDEASEYPAELVNKLYPTKFFDMKPFKQKEFDYYLENHEKWAMLFEVSWKNIRLRNPRATPVPYISTSKCEVLAFHKQEKGDPKKKKYEKAQQVDNGRVLSAKVLSTIITEQDYLIIKQQYKWEEEKITRVKVSKKKKLSKELVGKILEYYYNKTTLKQDEDDPNFDEDKDYNYKKSKNLINGIYGMHVTLPIRRDYCINNSDEIITIGDKIIYPHEVYEDMSKTDEELLTNYYSSFSSFLSYQVGIWCTAYARASLEEGIRACEREIEEEGKKIIVSDLIYCDTDSCKFLHPEIHLPKFEEINKRRRALAEKNNAFVDFNGRRYYLGVFEQEPTALKFKTFGAKKYMYSFLKKDPKTGEEYEDFKITISGVPKKKGKKCLEDAVKTGKYKSVFDLSKGFVFRGIKNTSVYMDHDKLQYVEVEGKKVYFASNVAMYPASYTLGLTYDFEILLEKFKDIMED